MKHLKPMFDVAKMLAPMFYDTRADEVTGLRGFERYMDSVEQYAAQGNPDSIRVMERFRALEANPRDRVLQQWFMNLRWSGVWGSMACPVVMVESAWASSASNMSIPTEMYEFVTPPWPAFMLQIPEDLGFVTEFDGVQEPLLNVCIGQMESLKSAGGEVWKHWMIFFNSARADAAGNRRMNMMAVRLDDLVGGSTEATRGGKGAVGRTLRFLFPLIGAVCMASKSSDLIRKRSSKAIAKRGAMYPTTQQYVVGKPVRLDLRMRVKEFIAKGEGSTGPMTIQTLVRGHWKNQRHGPAGKDRKFIHIEPYWRGPEDAPIAVRPHIIGGSEQSGG